MATTAAEIMLRCVYHGSLSMRDMEIERRPYHRNCGCARHKSKTACSTACIASKNISFPKKQLWNEWSLSIAASKFSYQSSNADSRTRTREDAYEGSSSG